MKTLYTAKREAQLQHEGKTNLPPERKRRISYPALPPEEKKPILEQARDKLKQMGFDLPNSGPRVYDGIGAMGNRGPVFFFTSQMRPWVTARHDFKIRNRVIELIRRHGHEHVLENLIKQSSLQWQIMEVVSDLF